MLKRCVYGLGKLSVFMYLIFVLSISSIQVFAQSSEAMRTQLQFENFYGAKSRTGNSTNRISGSECLIDDWLPVEITFPNGTTQFNQGKLNLVNASAEVIYKEREMYISSEHIKSIKLTTQERWFVPGPKFYYKDVALQGLMEIYEPTPKPPYIMMQHYVYIKEPSSNGYINAGLLESTLMTTSKIFLHDGIKLIPINGKKDIEKFYSSNKPLYIKYKKELGTDFRDAKSLHKLINTMQAAIETN
jgi:hypothetical protein